MQLSRKGIPAEMIHFKHREVLSTEVYWQSDGPLSMSSNVVQTASGKKNGCVVDTQSNPWYNER